MLSNESIVKSMFLVRCRSPGYVKSYKSESKFLVVVNHHQEQHHPNVGHGHVDDNSCIEGSVLGAIGGGGAGAALSRGDGRWWAIPLGIVGGAMIGCQIDGG